MMIFMVINPMQSPSYSVFPNNSERGGVMGEHEVTNPAITIIYPFQA